MITCVKFILSYPRAVLGMVRGKVSPKAYSDIENNFKPYFRSLLHIAVGLNHSRDVSHSCLLGLQSYRTHLSRITAAIALYREVYTPLTGTVAMPCLD